LIEHDQIDDRALRSLIRQRVIILAGHRKNRIFGRLDCRQGKGMLRSNRVFFANAAQAKERGFRPCGRCLRAEFMSWRAQTS